MTTLKDLNTSWNMTCTLNYTILY